MSAARAASQRLADATLTQRRIVLDTTSHWDDAVRADYVRHSESLEGASRRHQSALEHFAAEMDSIQRSLQNITNSSVLHRIPG